MVSFTGSLCRIEVCSYHYCSGVLTLLTKACCAFWYWLRSTCNAVYAPTAFFFYQGRAGKGHNWAYVVYTSESSTFIAKFERVIFISLKVMYRAATWKKNPVAEKRNLNKPVMPCFVLQNCLLNTEQEMCLLVFVHSYRPKRLIAIGLVHVLVGILEQYRNSCLTLLPNWLPYLVQ